MFKTLAASIAVTVISATAAAQGAYPNPHRPSPSADIRDTAQDVQSLVTQSLHRLDYRDRQVVERSLQRVLETFARNGIYPARYQPVPRQLVCDSYNNALIELGVGTVFDFGNRADCEAAKVAVERGEPFCNSSDNVLYDSTARKIHDFSNTADCTNARLRVRDGRRFCDSYDNTLRDPNGTLVHDFGNRQDCENALTH